MTNRQTLLFAQNYFETFCSLFEMTSEGSLQIPTPERLVQIETWFNNSYTSIFLLTGVRTKPLHFQPHLGGEYEENFKILMHIYSLSYVCMLHFAKVLKKEIPTHFTRPALCL
jgi:hypothetical protein